MSNGFHKVVYQLGSRYRNPSLGKSFQFLKQSESWSREEQRKYQLEKVRALLQWASATSPYYQRKFESAGFRPEHVDSLESLAACPTITKAELIEHNDEIHSTRSTGKTFLAETSGSTGQPLVFRRNEEWDSFIRASVWRGLSWHGVNPWDRNGYLWGYNISPKSVRKIGFLDFLQNRFRIFTYDRQALKAFVDKLKSADFVGGYSSMIYEIARIIVQEGLDTGDLNLKLVKGTSEKIHSHYHEASRQAFGRSITSEYGAAETGIIAFESPEGNMLINTEGVIVEEENGEIIVTNLHSLSFPVIRYRLGDFIELAPESETCPSGMQHPILKSVTGRIGKKVYGKEKTYPSLTFYYVAKNLFFDHGIGLNYQFVQNEKGRLLLRIEGGLSPDLRSLIDGEMQRYFGDDIDYEIRPGEKIHTMEAKAKDFVSTLD